MESPVRFHVVAGPVCVEAWSTERLPFEPRGWKRELREEIRRGLRQLEPREDSFLSAAYTSITAGRCDAENILFYNVGPGAFARLSGAGLGFTKVPLDCPVPPELPSGPFLHHHRYSLEPIPTPWSQVNPIATVTGAPLGDIANPAHVWWAVRQHLETRSPSGPVEVFGMSLVLAEGGATCPSLAHLFKVLVDGVVAALHCHDGSRLDEVSRRLAGRLGIEERLVRDALMDDSHAMLGRTRLLWPFGSHGLQWNPRDEDCVSGELLPDRGATGRGPLELVGQVWQLELDAARRGVDSSRYLVQDLREAGRALGA